MWAERKIVQNAVFHGKRHDNSILKCKSYCREILLLLRRLLLRPLGLGFLAGRIFPDFIFELPGLFADLVAGFFLVCVEKVP